MFVFFIQFGNWGTLVMKISGKKAMSKSVLALCVMEYAEDVLDM